MIGYQAQSYKTPCGTISGGYSELFWFDPDDINFTQAVPSATLLHPPYTALAFRDNGEGEGATPVTTALGAGLFPIDIEEETGTFKATQSISGRSIKWDYEIGGEVAKVGNAMTNFFARLDIASICSNIGLVIVDNTGAILIVAEKWVNNKIIPKFKMKNDGSEMHIEATMGDKNGATLSLKGVYSRGPIEFTGGRAALEAFIVKTA